MRGRKLAYLCLILLLCTTPSAFMQDTSADQETVYVIQPGDTLLSIARRFDTTITAIAEENGIVNPSLIYWGQRLRIPNTATTTADEPAETTEPVAPDTPVPDQPATIPYVVRAGDTLYRIAVRNGTTVSQLLALNPDIGNSNILFANQTINIPNPDAPPQPVTDSVDTPTTIPSATPAPSNTPVTEQEATASEVGETPTTSPTEQIEISATPDLTTPATVVTEEFDPEVPVAVLEYGLEANLNSDDAASFATSINALGVGWVKQNLSWRDFEPVEGEIDFAALDRIIDALSTAPETKIMLTITAAPGWARSIQEENGPPDDFADFGTFLSAVATRYAGRVHAYEVWNEPNLRSRWKSTVHQISPSSYVKLLRVASEAIKAADTAAIVVSAGLAPTGYNDALNAEVGNLEVNAIDDRVFLNEMFVEGVNELVDAIGVHPIGWANPPDALCCDASEGVETHYENPRFYFLETLSDYRQIQSTNGSLQTPLWVTRFGWGSSEDLGPPEELNVFTSYTSLQEQAEYTIRAFDLAESLGYVGPMFTYNLNGCLAPGDDGPASCYYSLIGPTGAPRPVFDAIQDRLADGEQEEIVVTATPEES